jgi:hypothetical protein
MVLGVLTGWLDCREREAVAYLIEGTGCCGINLRDVGWPPERTELAVRP